MNLPEPTSSARPPAPPLRIARADLPLCCPRPSDTLWNMHPRVYLPIADLPEQRAVCPYCGATYWLDPHA